MAIFKSLTFDGVNSLDYGIYITGEAVYNAPERAVEMVTIPGKNGALALDQGRFENIEVTYHAGCFADSQADFADKVMQFRNALASRYTYKRLTDEYHPDEYRFGLYKSGLDVDAVRYGTAGEFNIVFDCKPQRFLTDGDRAILPTEWSDVQTATGELVTIDSDGSLAVKALEVSLEPIQDLNGYDKPWAGGAGKNKLVYPYTRDTLTVNGVTFTANGDGSVVVDGTSTAKAIFTLQTSMPLENGTYILSGGKSWLNFIGLGYYATDSATDAVRVDDIGNGAQFTAYQGTVTYIQIVIKPGQTINNEVFYPMIRLASESDATYEPYSNICPISGHTEVVTIVSPTTSASDGTTYHTDLGRTVYGGTLDVVSGELVVDRAMVDLGSLSWAQDETAVTGASRFYASMSPTAKTADSVNLTAISSAYSLLAPGGTYSASATGFTIASGGRVFVYDASAKSMTASAFKTYVNGKQLAYTIATPQTYQLTPQQIDLLLGTNHLWSDGEITLTYGVHPYHNPTPFDAKPLIKVTGRGTLGIGEYILTITGTASQTLYIDCETMEIYTLEGTVPTGASSLVSINKNDFPVLEPGTNYISVGSGITAVTITPRWWRI